MEAVQDFPECDACLDRQSESEAIEICPKCRRQILPQLKQPGWARLIGFTNPEEEKEAEPDAPTAKAQRRNARKFGKNSPTDEGLTCHFCVGGCSAPVSSRGLMCGPCGEETRSRSNSRKVSGVHYTGLAGQPRIA